MKIRPLYYSALLLTLLSCGNNDKKEFVPSSAVDDKPVSSEVQPAKILVSKGIVRSENEVNVYSSLEGQLLDFKWLEGMAVKKGETLFNLDESEFKAKVMLSEGNREQASVRMEEILIGQGYKRGEFKSVPKDIMDYARIKSGLNVAEIECEINKEKLSRTVITAPMSGLLTGITPLPYSFVKPGSTLCRIVDPYHLKVEFSILETELRRFTMGKTVEVKVIANGNATYKAEVISIGSVVDESGMVKIEATLLDSEGLLPGMTAIVSL